MDKKVKLALLALLGFSTACSTVKSGSQSKDQEVTGTEQPMTIVMYGVRPPVQDNKVNEIREEQLAAPAAPVSSVEEVPAGTDK